jgi:hypothetical protein
MKKYLMPVMLVFSVVFFNGCDLDSLPLNVPITRDFNLSGNADAVFDSETFSLDDYEDFVGDDINTVTYVRSAVRVLTVSDPDLTGNIVINLRNGSGFNFTATLNNVRPADYISDPYILNLTGEQVQDLNDYINSSVERIFTVSFEVTNISAATPPHTITGVFEAIFEVDTEL